MDRSKHMLHFLPYLMILGILSTYQEAFQKRCIFYTPRMKQVILLLQVRLHCCRYRASLHNTIRRAAARSWMTVDNVSIVPYR